MAERTLPPPLRDAVERLGSADIMVGIPSYRNAATIGHVVRAAQAGLVQYFPDLRPVRGQRGRRLAATAPGASSSRPSRPTTSSASCSCARATGWAGSASPTPRSMASAARARRSGPSSRWPMRSGSRRWWWSTPTSAPSCPEWIELLAGPIVKGGFDFVAPLYARYKWDGTITNTVAYPFTRALYGLRIRQPIGGDFGVSGDLVRHYLAQDDWTPDVSRFGIDIWMTTTAIAGGFAVCQTRLGAKVHDPKDPGGDLGPMFSEVVEHAAAAHHGACRPVAVGDRLARRPGLRLRAVRRPAAAGHRRAAAARRARAGPADLRRRPGPDALAAGPGGRRGPAGGRRGSRSRRRSRRRTCRGDTAAARRSSSPMSSGRVSSTTSALAVRRGAVPVDRLVAALVPLYYGRVAALVIETREMTTEEAEAVVERQAAAFELAKPAFVERWRAIDARAVGRGHGNAVAHVRLGPRAGFAQAAAPRTRAR